MAVAEGWSDQAIRWATTISVMVLAAIRGRARGRAGLDVRRDAPTKGANSRVR
ncbi:hypothetical protein GCM10022254_34300 [Actinomadura meridiana]|uniref:Transposase n=1 Tax=Actinomadura meridiana TaxID=559626 RepID=A0ABP8C3E6_9ACTN